MSAVKKKQGFVEVFKSIFTPNDLKKAVTTYETLLHQIEELSSKLEEKALALFQLRSDAYSIISTGLKQYVNSIPSCPIILNNSLCFAKSNYNAIFVEYNTNPAKFNFFNPDNIVETNAVSEESARSKNDFQRRLERTRTLLAITTSYVSGIPTPNDSSDGLTVTNTTLAWLNSFSSGLRTPNTILGFVGTLAFVAVGMGVMDHLITKHNQDQLLRKNEQLNQLVNKMKSADIAIQEILDDTKQGYDNIVGFLSDCRNVAENYNLPAFDKAKMFSALQSAKTLSKLSKQTVKINYIL